MSPLYCTSHQQSLLTCTCKWRSHTQKNSSWVQNSVVIFLPVYTQTLYLSVPLQLHRYRLSNLLPNTLTKFMFLKEVIMVFIYYISLTAHKYHSGHSFYKVCMKKRSKLGILGTVRITVLRTQSWQYCPTSGVIHRKSTQTHVLWGSKLRILWPNAIDRTAMELFLGSTGCVCSQEKCTTCTVHAHIPPYAPQSKKG